MKNILSKVTAFFLLILIVYVFVSSMYTFGILGPVVFLGVLEIIHKIRGGRLNRYYTFVLTKDGIELQHNPIFIFFYADMGKMLEFAEDALEKLSRKYPNENIFAYTVTLAVLAKRKKIDYQDVNLNFWGHVGSYHLVISNIKNWRNLQFIRFFRKIDISTAKKVVLRTP